MNIDGLRPWAGLGAGEARDVADVVVAGIAYDGSAVYRKGAALAPTRIRQLSTVMPPVTEDGRALAKLLVDDIGDLDPGPDIQSGWLSPADRLSRIPPSAFLTVLGGDHSIAIATLAAQARRHPGLSVLWVDAHPDLNDFSRGGRWTCGCALRRALESSLIEPSRVVIAGGRDFDSEELEFITTKGVLLITTYELTHDFAGSMQKIAARIGGSKVHISFDIDVLDPAFAPATEIPSAGGLSTREALDLLRAATDHSEIVGMDIVEVSPPFDNADITSFAALKLIFEVWGMALILSGSAGDLSEGHGNR